VFEADAAELVGDGKQEFVARIVARTEYLVGLLDERAVRGELIGLEIELLGESATTLRNTGCRPARAASGSRSKRLRYLPAKTGESTSVSASTGLNSIREPLWLAASSAVPAVKPSGSRRLGLTVMPRTA